MAVIAIISLLLAISLPVLSSVFLQSSELKCLVHIRSAAVAVGIYADDHRGYVPYGGRETHAVRAPYGEKIQIGGVFGLSDGRWSVLMPDSWSGDDWSEGMRCPKQPEYDPDSPPWSDADLMTDGFSREPFYWLSSAFHLTVASLDQVVEHSDRFEVAPQPLHRVRYPSSKSLLFEQFGFCIPDTPETTPWKDLAQTQLLPTSIVAVDGSALRFARRSAFRPANGLGCDFTLHGVQGRDIDRSREGLNAFDRLNGNTWGEPPQD